MPYDKVFSALVDAEKRAQEMQAFGGRTAQPIASGYWLLGSRPDACIWRSRRLAAARRTPAPLGDERLDKLSMQAFGLYSTMFGRYTIAVNKYLASPAIHDVELSARMDRVRRVMTRCRERSGRRSAAMETWCQVGDKLGFVP